MDVAFKLVAFILIVYVVQSKEIVRNGISFKFNEKIIYDCVDIHNQPSLNHPLLQNHKIQMEPSFSIVKQISTTKSESGSANETIIKCLNGTVPIQRNTQKYVGDAQVWGKRNFNPLTIDSHGTHIAGIRVQDKGPYHGLSAWMSLHYLNVSKGQASYANVYVGGGANNKVNFIQMGWMVNPSLFGDGRSWSYGFWKGVNGAGCFNTICPGFVQVSKTEVLSGPLPNPRKNQGIRVSLQQDEKSGNWWASDVTGSEVHIGYWPKELFDLISSGADIVGVEGAVQTSPSGVSPPMGNGHLPSKDENKSARVKNLLIIDSNFKIRESNNYKLEELLDNNKCYGLKKGKKSFFFMPNLFTYGGPGGISCGI